MSEEAFKPSNKLISIIVPVYQVDQFLNKCIESLLNQTYKNIEVILIDDGSSDRSPKICDYWAEKDQRVTVKHITNHGVSYARNLGLQLAKGDYIGFVDPDDWVYPETYQRMIEVILECHAEICCGGFNIIQDNGDITRRAGEKQVLNQKEAIKSIYSNTQDKHLTWTLCDKLFESEIIKNIKFESHLKLSEDQLLLWQVLKQTHLFVYVPINGYNYVMRDGSATHKLVSPAEGTYIDAISVIKSEAKFMDEDVFQVIDGTYWNIVYNVLRKLLFQYEDLKEFNNVEKYFIIHWQRVLRKNILSIMKKDLTPKSKLGICYFCLPFSGVMGLKKAIKSTLQLFH